MWKKRSGQTWDILEDRTQTACSKKEDKWYHFKVFNMTSLSYTELWLNQIITYPSLCVKMCLSRFSKIPDAPQPNNKINAEFLSKLFKTLLNKVPNALSNHNSPLFPATHLLSLILLPRRPSCLPTATCQNLSNIHIFKHHLSLTQNFSWSCNWIK